MLLSCRRSHENIYSNTCVLGTQRARARFARFSASVRVFLRARAILRPRANVCDKRHWTHARARNETLQVTAGQPFGIIVAM